MNTVEEITIDIDKMVGDIPCDYGDGHAATMAVRVNAKECCCYGKVFLNCGDHPMWGSCKYCGRFCSYEVIS